MHELEQVGVLPIVRAPSADAAWAMCIALVNAGAPLLEVSLTVPDGVEVIQKLVRHHGSRVLVGAGTVLDPESARLAIASGASFLVSPSLAPGLVRVAHRYQVPMIVGAFTPTEVLEALEEGADAVKLFPARTVGPQYLRALRAALPQAPIVPTGGVSLDTVGGWFLAGAMAIAVGSELTRSGEPEVVANAWLAWRQAVAAAREN